MLSNSLAALLKLPAKDRVGLAIALWESFTDDEREAELVLTPEQEAELDALYFRPIGDAIIVLAVMQWPPASTALAVAALSLTFGWSGPALPAAHPARWADDWSGCRERVLPSRLLHANEVTE